MGRNGSGIYQLPAGQPVVTGTTISSTVHNTLANDLANALTTSIATDGQSVVTANIPFSGYKLTNLGAATTNGDAIRYEDMGSFQQAQTFTAFTTGGTSTAYTLTPVPAITSLIAGQRFRVKMSASNGATPTLAVSGLTAKSIKVYDSAGAKTDPSAAQLASGMLVDVEYDGTDWVAIAQMPPVLSVARGGTGGTRVSNTIAVHTGVVTPIPDGTTGYMGASGYSATEVAVSFAPAYSGTVAAFRAAAGAAGSGARIYTVVKNGVDQTMTALSVGAATQCETSSNPVSFAAGDTLSVKLVTSGGANTSFHTVCLLIYPL